MTKNNFLSISLTPRQTLWGLRYLLFQTIFLSSVLHLATSLLPFTLGAAQLNFLYFAINFVAVIVIFRNFLLQFLQLDWDGIGAIALWGVVFFGAYWLSTAFLSHVFSIIDPKFFNANDRTIAGMTEENYPLMFIGTVVLVPITEECLYRGLVFRGLYQRSAVLAWIVCPVVFSLVHIVSYLGQVNALTFALCFLQYIPAGLCLAAAYRLSGSLICPILIHAVINAMGMIALR